MSGFSYAKKAFAAAAPPYTALGEFTDPIAGARGLAASFPRIPQPDVGLGDPFG